MITPPFRADHIGSFLRPDNLMDAVRARRADMIDDSELERAQNAAIKEIVEMQESMGLRSVTDGEFRRRGWSAGFIDAVSGFGLREGAIGFKKDGKEQKAELSPFASGRLKRNKPIVANDLAFVKSTAKSAMPKATIASPSVMHYFLGPLAVDKEIYPDIEEYYFDLAAIYREEILALHRIGCTYLQLDETALPCNCDPKFRAVVEARGENPDGLTSRYSQLINEAIEGRPDGMVIGMHMCRGNLKGTWMAEGGYDPIAELIFPHTKVDAWFMEYDTERAGDFTPLRFMPDDKKVVLGLVSTKTPELEDKDMLKRRIDEASKYIPMERLCLSPQCGFSSAPGRGQVLTEDDQRRKLSLVVETAEDVWGSI